MLLDWYSLIYATPAPAAPPQNIAAGRAAAMRRERRRREDEEVLQAITEWLNDHGK